MSNKSRKELRAKAMNCLRQLEPHSPVWVQHIRNYIDHLEWATALPTEGEEDERT